jgi:hypothetical protein
MKILTTCLFICFVSSLSMAQKPPASSQLYRFSVGKYQFDDPFKLVNKIEGYSLGLDYERLFLRHWSLSFGFEYGINNNAVPGLKIRNPNINLPEKEHRFALNHDLRYYLLYRPGSGIYLGNSVSIQYLYKGEVAQSCDALACSNINGGFKVYNSKALVDRLTIGYQIFIDSKAIVGVSIGYEFRFQSSYGIIRSPEISVHIGFAK